VETPLQTPAGHHSGRLILLTPALHFAPIHNLLVIEVLGSSLSSGAARGGDPRHVRVGVLYTIHKLPNAHRLAGEVACPHRF
jgi:hypothetical protein